MSDAKLIKKKPVSVDEMNLKSIQRLDPCAIAIIDKSAHAALYRFDKSKTEWLKTEIEGPLFLYKRADKPVHSLMIANRQSLEDHIEPITPPIRFFLEAPYLFMNTEDGDIRGFWFFEEEDCRRLYEVLVKLAAGSSPTTSSASTNDSKRSVRGSALNGCSVESDASVGKENCFKRGDVMPALLMQLLSKETDAKLPDVPTTGAMSADQIEKQFLRDDAASEGSVVSPENVQSVPAKITRKRPPSLNVEKESDTLSNLLNDLSLTVANQAASSSKDSEKPQPKDKKEQDGVWQGSSTTVAPLTKEQLLAALKHLLKDDGFVTRLHRAYLESINTRLGLRE